MLVPAAYGKPAPCGMIVNTVESLLHSSVRLAVGSHVMLSAVCKEVSFIGSLKVTTIGWLDSTPLAPNEGTMLST